MTELTIERAVQLAPTIDALAAARRVAAGAVLIDVRSDAGRAATGTIPGATLVAKTEVGKRFALNSPDRVAAVTSLDTPVVVICGSVLGSGPVAAELIQLGFTDVTQVDGGFPAWREAGLPTEAPTAG